MRTSSSTCVRRRRYSVRTSSNARFLRPSPAFDRVLKLANASVRTLFRSTEIPVVTNYLTTIAMLLFKITRKPSLKVTPTTLATFYPTLVTVRLKHFGCLLLIHSFQFRSAFQPRSAIGDRSSFCVFSSGGIEL